jgi:hypothetical protein
VTTPAFSLRQADATSLHRHGDLPQQYEYIANIVDSAGEASVEASRAEIAHLLISTVPPNSYGIVCVDSRLHDESNPFSGDVYANIQTGQLEEHHEQHHRFGYGTHRPMNTDVEHHQHIHVGGVEAHQHGGMHSLLIC